MGDAVKLLRWFRLVDAHGHLDLTTVAIYVGLGCLFVGWVTPFVVAVALVAVEKLIADSQTRLAMEGAQEAGLLKMQQGEEEERVALKKKVDALAARVAELSAPDRDAALKRVLGGKRE
jgi:hypothetical protein